MKGVYLTTAEGAKLFSALAEADPEAALRALQKTIGKWSKEELQQFATGRREVVWSLEKIAVWKNLFQDAARLLLALGEAENETWGNNASGIFVGLFSLGYGKVAPTECPPADRFSILKEAMESKSKERRDLALRACSTALQTGHFSRMVGAEYQGLRKEPELWMPKTYGELFDAYRQVWDYLYSQIELLQDEEQQKTIDILINNIRGVGKIQALSQLVINTIKELVSRPYVDGKKVLEGILSFLHYDGKELPNEIRSQWEQIRDDLTGFDFPSLMKRYVGMDVFEDKFDEEGNQIDQAQPKIERLAEQAVKDKDLIEKELSWLVTGEAVNGYRFGYELGKRDKGFSLWSSLYESQIAAGKDSNVFFLSGYLRSMYEKDPEGWEKQMDSIAKSKTISKSTPELTWRSGMTDRSAERILNLAEEGIVTYEQFSIFGYGSVIKNLSEDKFQAWIEYLLKIEKQGAIHIAMDLYHFFYVYGEKQQKRKMPRDLTLRLLTHPMLFIKDDKSPKNQMEEHNWTEIGNLFIKKYPDKSMAVCQTILEHFGDEGTIFDRFQSPFQSVLDEISRQHPVEVWHALVKYLDPPLDSRAFHIKEWLRGGRFFSSMNDGKLSIFPVEEIWKWVDADVDVRSWHLATFVPKTLFRDKEKVCLARELLIKYGDREDVRNSLHANFWSEGWTGPASLHYSKKKENFLKLIVGETDKNVLLWLSEFIASLDEQIRRSKAEEERRGF